MIIIWIQIYIWNTHIVGFMENKLTVERRRFLSSGSDTELPPLSYRHLKAALINIFFMLTMNQIHKELSSTAL